MNGEAVNSGGLSVVLPLGQRKGEHMVYTVTFNPSLDYIVSVEGFELGMTNRTSSELMLPGGKGINVSIVLSNLGIDNTALGFVAGFTGEEIVREVEQQGIRSDFIKLDQGISRINLKMKNIDGTEINGQGPDIGDEQVRELMGRLDALTSDDVLVLAGSIPATMPDDIYQQIMKRLADRSITIAVDATKDLLLNVLPFHPFVIKPNHHELGEIFGVKLSEWEDVIPYAKKLQERGARNVLVSMGGKGAVLLAENGEVMAGEASKGEVKNTVGAGDSMVAGFLAGWMKEKSYREAFRMGLASGGASACSEMLATREEVEAERGITEIQELQ